MGGGGSKQEENQANQQPTPFQKGSSNRNSKNPSPRPEYKEYKESKLRESLIGNVINNYLPEPNINREQNGSQNSQKVGVESPQNIRPQYFTTWPSKFQKNDHLRLRIFITVIEPTFQIRKLEKKQSEHDAELSWQYEKVKNGRNSYFLLRFILNEDGGWTQRWLFDQQSNCLEGDESIWSVICPIRVSEQVQKVGGYLCQRSYQSSQNQYDQHGEERKLDTQIFKKWGQKPTQSRPSMKKLLSKKKMIEDLKNQKGFEYSETTRYFSINGDWAFSVVVEEKHNSFKSWILQLHPQSNSKQLDKITAMSSTLKNDIQTRETMYIEEMKKKRDIVFQMKQRQ